MVDVVLGACAAVAAAVLLSTVSWSPLPGSIAVVVVAALAPALVRVDLTERRLPNLLTVPLIVTGALAAVDTAVRGDWLAPIAALGMGVILLVLAVTGGMGMGDVKLGLALTLVASALGWWTAILALFAAFVLGGVAGVVHLTRGEKTLPFGPWLIAGWALATLFAVLSK